MRFSILAAAIVLGLFLNVGSTNAAEKKTTVSDNVLAQVGLADMQEVSDEAGMQIRGKGWSHHHHHHHHHHHGHHGHHHHGHGHKHKHKHKHKW